MDNMEEVMQKVLNQKNMRPFLEEKMLPDLRLGIKELLQQIIQNKELDRHWQSKERENQKLIKATRRADRDRKRLEQGSNYHSEDEGKIDSESESEDESDSYYDSECTDEIEERDSELDVVVTPSGDNSQAQLQVTSALGEIRQSEELQSKSALGGAITIMKEPNSATKQQMMGGTMNSTKRARSIKSFHSRSRHSISHQSHFNPLRFLAMGLIEKNQERKEIERKRQQELLQVQTKSEQERLALDKLNSTNTPSKNNEGLAEIQSEDEDEDATGNAKLVNVEIKKPGRRGSPIRKGGKSPEIGKRS